MAASMRGPHAENKSTIINLFCGNLSAETTPKDLGQVFENKGFEICWAKIPIQRAKVLFGFVGFLDHATTLRALKHTDGIRVGGRVMHVELGRFSRQQGPTGRSYGPRGGAHRGRGDDRENGRWSLTPPRSTSPRPRYYPANRRHSASPYRPRSSCSPLPRHNARKKPGRSRSQGRSFSDDSRSSRGGGRRTSSQSSKSQALGGNRKEEGGGVSSKARGGVTTPLGVDKTPGGKKGGKPSNGLGDSKTSGSPQETAPPPLQNGGSLYGKLSFRLIAGQSEEGELESPAGRGPKPPSPKKQTAPPGIFCPLVAPEAEKTKLLVFQSNQSEDIANALLPLAPSLPEKPGPETPGGGSWQEAAPASFSPGSDPAKSPDSSKEQPPPTNGSRKGELTGQSVQEALLAKTNGGRSPEGEGEGGADVKQLNGHVPAVAPSQGTEQLPKEECIAASPQLPEVYAPAPKVQQVGLAPQGLAGSAQGETPLLASPWAEAPPVELSPAELLIQQANKLLADARLAGAREAAEAKAVKAAEDKNKSREAAAEAAAAEAAAAAREATLQHAAVKKAKQVAAEEGLEAKAALEQGRGKSKDTDKKKKRRKSEKKVEVMSSSAEEEEEEEEEESAQLKRAKRKKTTRSRKEQGKDASRAPPSGSQELGSSGRGRGGTLSYPSGARSGLAVMAALTCAVPSASPAIRNAMEQLKHALKGVSLHMNIANDLMLYLDKELGTAYPQGGS